MVSFAEACAWFLQMRMCLHAGLHIQPQVRFVRDQFLLCVQTDVYDDIYLYTWRCIYMYIQICIYVHMYYIAENMFMQYTRYVLAVL